MIRTADDTVDFMEKASGKYYGGKIPKGRPREKLLKKIMHYKKLEDLSTTQERMKSGFQSIIEL